MRPKPDGSTPCGVVEIVQFGGPVQGLFLLGKDLNIPSIRWLDGILVTLWYVGCRYLLMMCVWFRVLSTTFQEAIDSLGGPSGTSNQHSQDRLILLGGLGDDDRRFRDAWQTTDFGLTWQELPCPKWSGRWAAKNGATSNTLNKFFRETVWLLGVYT